MAGQAYDYVITGAGPAGCVLAARLSADPKVKVLLLEAGPDDKDPYIHWPVGFYKMTGGTKNSWGYETVPLAHLDGRRMWFPQGRVLGGGGSINAQVFTRGHAKDYDAWAEEDGCTGWSYREILPYFRRAEDNERFSNAWHGTGGPLGVSDLISPHAMSKTFLRAAQEAGLPYNPDFNGERQEGCGLYQVSQRNGRRCSAAVAYLRPAMARPNLSVRTGALATRIVVEHGRATGVDYIEGQQPQHARAEREVLVTSGAVGSPKLLLLSGIGPADELSAHGIEPVHDLRGVGRNFQDHVDVYVISELNGPHSYNKHTQLHRQLWCAAQYYLFGSGPITSNLAEAGGFSFVDKAARSPDIQFHFLPGSGLEAGVSQLGEHGCTLNSCFLRPKSRGSVKLASADPFAAPPDRSELFCRGVRSKNLDRRLPPRPRDHGAAGLPPVPHGRAPAGTRGAERCRPHGLREAARQDRLPSGRQLQDGHRCACRRRPRASRARACRPSRLRFLDHAAADQLKHQRADHHDRREGRGPRAGRQRRHGARRRDRPASPGGLTVTCSSATTSRAATRPTAWSLRLGRGSPAPIGPSPGKPATSPLARPCGDDAGFRAPTLQSARRDARLCRRPGNP